MSYTKTIVCLANSRKAPSGWCIAGREVTPTGFGRWIRPVSSRPYGEISEQERQYEDGNDPRVMDVVEIAMSHYQPLLHQKENHVIDANYRWIKRSVAKWDDILSAAENPTGALWVNEFSSSKGLNDRVPTSRLNDLVQSLYLIRPNNLVLVVTSEQGDYGPRRRIRARFDFFRQSYCVVVTDPWIEKQLLAENDGETKLNDSLLCISLGEDYHGYAYKLAAAVITPQRSEK